MSWTIEHDKCTSICEWDLDTEPIVGCRHIHTKCNVYTNPKTAQFYAT